MKPSRQRVLIALRSFKTVAAAERSMNLYKGYIRKRLTAGDDEIREAADSCGNRRGLEATRQSEGNGIGGIIYKEQRRMSELCRVRGTDRRLIKASFHKRINENSKQEKAKATEAAVSTIDAMIAKPTAAPLASRLMDDDRWCMNCKTERCDDPCEVCDRHTLDSRP